MDWLILAPLLFFFAVFVAMGLIPLFVKPDRLRPPWWYWSLDDSKTGSKVEQAPEVKTLPVPAEKSPEVLAPKPAKPELPRW